MRGTVARGAAAVVCALVLSGYCAAQSAAAQSNSWRVVRGLAAGSKVEVRLVNGAKVQGKFETAYASGIELRTAPDKARYVPRAGIRKLYLTGKSAGSGGAWAGFAAGATIGAVYGAAKANCYTGPGGNGSPNCQSIQGRGAVEWGALFGIIGAIAGDAAGGLHRPKTLVYERDRGGGRPSPAVGGASRSMKDGRGLHRDNAAQPAYAWAAVQGLGAGSRVKVQLASGAKVRGKIVSVSATGLDLRTRHTIRYIRRARIRKLSLTGKPHTVRDAWIGFVTGEVAGSVYGGNADSGDCGPPPAPGNFYGYQPCQRIAGAVYGGAIFGAVGALGGALIGLVDSAGKLVYQSDAGEDGHAAKTAKRRTLSPAAAPAAAAGSTRH